ncbi:MULTISPECIES: hypothetical protein [unclassified Spiroplasma]|uniref:hypothetical protein n=1 Tax=unclassified Spiroplasma TaxID=2637901 RepID=UPI0030CF6B1A
MSKKRCKTKIKIKKPKKQNKFKNQNHEILVNKYEVENTKLIFCQKEGCFKEWTNVIDIDEFGKFFFCHKHANEYEEELPSIIDNLPKEQAIKIIEASKKYRE